MIPVGRHLPLPHGKSGYREQTHCSTTERTRVNSTTVLVSEPVALSANAILCGRHFSCWSPFHKKHEPARRVAPTLRNPNLNLCLKRDISPASQSSLKPPAQFAPKPQIHGGMPNALSEYRSKPMSIGRRMYKPPQKESMGIKYLRASAALSPISP